MKIDATHSIWPWIAEHAGFLLTRFEVGRDGEDRVRETEGQISRSTMHGILLNESCGKGSELEDRSGKLTCMWEDGIYLGVKATTAEVIVGNRNGVWLTRTVRRKPAKERCDRITLEMVVAVPSRKNEDDPKMDGERLKSEVIVMDKEYKEKLEAEEQVPVPKRVYISRSEVSGVHVVASGNCETSTYRKLSKANRGGAEGHSEGTRGDETHERVPGQSG